MVAKVVSLVRGLRNLHGSSQPLLAEADDGGLYIVKFQSCNAGQHELFNEAAGSALYRAIGLSVPNWRPVRVTQKFLDQNPMAVRETVTGRTTPSTGFAFASSLIVGHQNRCLDLLPSSAIARLRHAEMFWLAWLVDVCASHSDNRQAVFTESADGGIDATFIDHGRMFGGLTGFDRPKVLASRYLDARFYPEFTTATFRTVQRLLLRFNADTCLRQITTVPDTWVTSEGLSIFQTTLSRLSEQNVWENMLNEIVATHTRHKPQREHGTLQFGNAPDCRVLHSRVPGKQG